MPPHSDQKQRQIAFWKRHQSILKSCAELSTKCGAKILCVIAVPDEYIPMKQQDLSVDESTGDIRVVNTAGTAIVFDSFSDERVVGQRNPIINSISKINDQSRHFLVNFNVSVAGSIAVVLSPSTVAAYCTSDRRAVLPVESEPLPNPIKKRAREDPVVYPVKFDIEAERRKRQCAMMYGDMRGDLRPPAAIYLPSAAKSQTTPAKTIPETSIPPPAISGSRESSWTPPSPQETSPIEQPIDQPPPPPRFDSRFQPRSFASTLVNYEGPSMTSFPRPSFSFQRQPMSVQRPQMPVQRPLPLCNPFADVRAHFGSPVSSANVTPRTSYETVALCTVQKRDMLSLPNLNPRSSNEELAISGLSCLSAAASALRY